MDYRRDIEGLRAVAILLVVGAHTAIPGFEGGFVGVDIFFVLSGYLISGLLVSEHVESGRVDFASFYARRLRRLLPGLLVMLLITAFLAWWIIPISGQQEQAIAGAAAAVWVSNLHFLFQKLEYFGAAAESNIYLHTWSLGVEEQFYLAWPLLIVFLISRSKNLSNRSLVFVGLAVLLVLSWLLNIALTLWSARYTFYLMPTRAWQFAAGALLYLYNYRRAAGSRSMAESSGLLGVILIVAALLLVDSNTPYPGGWALLPTLATVCLIFSGGGNFSFVSRILSSIPMQGIGRVSYAWYLWHWPVLLLGASLLPQTSILNKALLVLVSLIAASATYFWIEQPIRRNDRILRKPIMFIQLALVASVASAVLLFYWGKNSQADASRLSFHNESSAPAIEVPIIYGMGCDDWYHSDRVVACTFGPQDAPKTAVAMGDSIGLQWFPALAKIFTAPEWRLIVITKSSCPMVNRPIYYARIGREYTECAVWRQRALAYIEDIHPQYVVLGSTHFAAYNKEQWISGTGELLGQIAPFSGQVAIMRSTPTLPFNGPDCLNSKRRLHRLLGWEPVCVSSAHDSRGEQVAAWLGEASRGWPNVQIIDMSDLVCPQGICRASKDGKLIFRDTQHLNSRFVQELAAPLSGRLGISEGG